MNIMTKRGNHDNVVTYEHICDAHADLANIPQDQIVLGSTAIVLNDEGEGFGVYMADSNKQWVRLMVGSGSGSSFNLSDSFHLCEEGEYDSETGMPTILNPSPDQIYFVPSGSSATGDTFNEWIYVDDAWERFGGGSAIVEGGQSDWEETDSSAAEFVVNKPAILKAGTGTAAAMSIVMNDTSENVASGELAIAQGSGTTASGAVSHAEGSGTTASGNASHAEGGSTTASGMASHVEGSNTAASGDASHAEGSNTLVSGHYAHAEGMGGQYRSDSHVDITSQAAGRASHTEGYQTTILVSGRYDSIGAHAEGCQTIAGSDIIDAKGAHAEGINTQASSAGTHAEGARTIASGNYAHAEGNRSVANAFAAHAEGGLTTASGSYAHAEGYGGTYTLNNVTYTSQTQGQAAHSEGFQTIARSTSDNITQSKGLHAEGYQTIAGNDQIAANGAHAEGVRTQASSGGAHAEGANTLASGQRSHAEGQETIANGAYAHAEGYGGDYTLNSVTYTSQAGGKAAHTEGYQTITKSANGSTTTSYGAHAEGFQTIAGNDTIVANGAHAEGIQTQASNLGAHAEGRSTTASGENSHAEGEGSSYNGANNNNITPSAQGYAAHVEGYETRTISSDSSAQRSFGAHAEGYRTTAGNALNFTFGAHAEGWGTISEGMASHAEGTETTASGDSTHAEGANTIATGYAAHAEGGVTTASAMWSHAGGAATIAATNGTTVIGFNNKNPDDSGIIGGWTNPSLRQDISVEKGAHPVFIIGNGVDENGGMTELNKSNAMVVYLDGHVCFSGPIYIVGANNTSLPINVSYNTADKHLYCDVTTKIPYVVYVNPTTNELYYYDESGNMNTVT